MHDLDLEHVLSSSDPEIREGGMSALVVSIAQIDCTEHDAGSTACHLVRLLLSTAMDQQATAKYLEILRMYRRGGGAHERVRVHIDRAIEELTKRVARPVSEPTYSSAVPGEASLTFPNAAY
ncbi:MAG: hypothetical protein UY63_C0009G0008 [Parcubacteria group bacterium GW2011_GWA2_51_10]|nr:MAG: hypothetical protein UY63_C0009G0008 [Parcubacteria group bacterium GW2011_GWA2_51_10]